jgi:hypothetical protein
MKTKTAACSIGALVLGAGFLSGCSATAPKSGDGAAELMGSLSSALSLIDVVEVTVTVSGDGISLPIVQDLAQSAGQWEGQIGNIPAGPSRHFHADAFDSSHTAVYSGDADSVTIMANVTAAVMLTLQQTAAPTPFQNESPVIDSFVASLAAVAPGASVSLDVTAHDPNAGDTLTYAWSATSGTFAQAATLATTWTAPAAVGLQTVTIQVTDEKGAMAALSLQIDVEIATGAAAVSVVFNTWPVVQSVIATPSHINVGQTTQLALTASDADGDALTYTWTASCAGSFSNPSAAQPSFMLAAPLPANNRCELTVSVNDGRGGTNAGTIGIDAGPTVLPTIDGGTASTSNIGSAWVTHAGSPGAVYAISDTTPAGDAAFYVWSANNFSSYTSFWSVNTALPQPPVAVDQGMTWVGSNLYVLTAGDLLRFTPSADSSQLDGSWQVLEPSMPLAGTNTTHDDAGNLLAFPADNTLRLMKVASTTLSLSYIGAGTGGYHSAVTWDSSTQLLYVGFGNGTIESVDTTNGAVTNIWPHPEGTLPNASPLFCGDRQGRLFMRGGVGETRFWMFTIATATWLELPVLAQPLDANGGCTIGGDGELYVVDNDVTESLTLY